MPRAAADAGSVEPEHSNGSWSGVRMQRAATGRHGSRSISAPTRPRVRPLWPCAPASSTSPFRMRRCCGCSAPIWGRRPPPISRLTALMARPMRESRGRRVSGRCPWGVIAVGEVDHQGHPRPVGAGPAWSGGAPASRRAGVTTIRPVGATGTTPSPGDYRSRPRWHARPRRSATLEDRPATARASGRPGRTAGPWV